MLIIEKTKTPGGCATLSGGVVYAAGTTLQKEAGVDDTPDGMFKYWMAMGQGLNNLRYGANLVRRVRGPIRVVESTRSQVRCRDGFQPEPQECRGERLVLHGGGTRPVGRRDHARTHAGPRYIGGYSHRGHTLRRRTRWVPTNPTIPMPGALAYLDPTMKESNPAALRSSWRPR